MNVHPCYCVLSWLFWRGVHALFCHPAREGLGAELLQTSQFSIKTLLFTGISVKNCMQLYAIEKPQITANTIRAFVSLSCEECTERSRPGLRKQRHVVRSQAVSLLHPLSPWLPCTVPFATKWLRELQPSCLCRMPQVGKRARLPAEGPASSSFSGNPHDTSSFISLVTRPHLAAREMFSLQISVCQVKTRQRFCQAGEREWMLGWVTSILCSDGVIFSGL